MFTFIREMIARMRFTKATEATDLMQPYRDALNSNKDEFGRPLGVSQEHPLLAQYKADTAYGRVAGEVVPSFETWQQQHVAMAG